MKYKELFTEDEYNNEDGIKFQEEYKGLVIPLIEKYMLLGFSCKDMECIMVRALALPIVGLQMKRLHGLDPFKKEEETNKSPCEDCMDNSSCPVFKKHGKGSYCPFILINNVILHPDETLREDLKWCPNCGTGAKIITWQRELGIHYRCVCGLTGRFGDGTSEPSEEQPGFEGEEK
jgi:predicted RNA-binding Zn-ribbon protein involved in translation (DUF1610 family)